MTNLRSPAVPSQRENGVRASPRRLLILPGALIVGLFLVACLSGAADPVISEFMAANQGSLLDDDGESSDWIEILNPDAQRVNLQDWSLTDNLENPRKWVFPARFLEPGEYLVVFASGKNRSSAGNLHTNFRLEADGEYLGLFPPGSSTAASEFRPAFPRQEPDVSFGTPSSGSVRDLLSGSLAYVLVPEAENDLPVDWTAPGFIPGSLWQMGPGLGVGFDDTPTRLDAEANLALTGTASQSSTGFGFGAERAIDGDPSSFTHTDTDDNASTWWVNLGKTVEVRRIVLHNRDGCCGSRLRDVTVQLLAPDGQTVVWSSELLNPENILGSPAAIIVDLIELNVGAIPAQTVRVFRIPDPDLSGGGGNADEDNVLSLGEVEVYGVETLSYGPFVRTDLAATMPGRNSSAFVRVPFVLEDPDAVQAMHLHLRYDDGAVVYLNGARVASFNAPTGDSWNSAAVGRRVKAEVFVPAVVDLVPFRAVWKRGTNWLAIHGLNAAATDPDFLVEAQLLAESRAPVAGVYFEHPTPGTANESPWNLGRVADTTFSVKRGRMNAPFDLEITTTTPDAEIRFTLDGSTPDATRGQVYSGSIHIEHTTVVRAAAFKKNYRPTDVDTHTYLFLSDVVTQPTRPSGFPASWLGVPGDYAMDPRIAQSAEYGRRMTESLSAIPSMVLTTDVDNLFGSSRGIYSNPERSGLSWERPISLEWINEDGTARFQVNCGLRIQGGYFRDRHVTQKHSLRLLFKDEYGPGKLREDVFHEFGAAREFDTLVLRAGANDGYAWDAARDTEQFIRDEFGRRLLLNMGQPSARGRFVHLYLNGLYWGLYNLTERPAEDFSATYLGGVAEDWDTINSGEVKNGSLDAWNAFLAGVRAVTSLANYQRLKGLNPDGSRNAAFPEYFDGPNYMDYMLVNIWGGNWDWPNKNFWFGRQRGGLAGGFKFYIWDFENTMGNNRDRSPLNMVSPRAGTTGSWVGEPHDRLRRFSEYRMEFADRVQKHFFGDGVLAPASLVPRYRDLAAQVESAVIAETARWGDDHFSPPQVLSDWQRERDWILGSYLPQRTGIVLAQLRAAGLYPQTDAPALAPRGGPVSPVLPVLLSTVASEIYYTTNGVDPRLPGGAVHPDAVRVTFPGGGSSGTTNSLDPFFIAQPTTIRARAREGADWSALTEGQFVPEVLRATSNHLVISEFCYRPADPATQAETAVSSNRDDFEFLEIMNISSRAVDLTGVRFAAGILFNFPSGTVVGSGQRLLLVRNKAAFEARYGAGLPVVGEYDGNLANEGEEIALVDFQGADIRRFQYLDRSPWPPGPNRNGYSLVLVRPDMAPDHRHPTHWRSSVRTGGSPGNTDASSFTGASEADANGNGQADLLDYALGAVLTAPGGGIQILIESFAAEGGGEAEEHLVVSLPRSLGADDAVVTLEVTEALSGPWHRDPPSFVLLGEERATEQTVRQTFRLDPALGPTEVMFLRVLVSLTQ